MTPTHTRLGSFSFRLLSLALLGAAAACSMDVNYPYPADEARGGASGAQGAATLGGAPAMSGGAPASSGGGSAAAPAPAPELEFPANYRGWPGFVLGVQRADVKQIRDIYVNPEATSVARGAAFPNGTVLVMDLFEAQKDSAGQPVLDGAGQMSKGALLKIFIMSKQPGWGNAVEADVRNGDWYYFAYAADGKTELSDPLRPCFACHLDLGTEKDYLFGYDEYFAGRASASQR